MTGSRRVRTILSRTWLCLSLTIPAYSQSAHPDGVAALELTTKTEDGKPVAQARIDLRPSQGSARTGSTDAAGELRLADLAPGSYQLRISASGFAELTTDVTLAAGPPNRVDVTLTPSMNRSESVTVVGVSESPLEQSPSPATPLDRQVVRNTPDRPATVNDALPLAPGIIRGPNGLLQLSGSGEHRSSLLVNSADATDPATGQFGATAPIDAVQTMNVLTSPFLAEYGRFTSNVVSVETRRGGDKWSAELNDPLPEFRFRSWHMRGLRSGTPRFNFGGPLISNRLYFLESAQYELRNTPVITLPFPLNEQRREGLNSLTELDYIISSTNILTATMHAAVQRTRFANLDLFNPQPTTPDLANRNYSAALTDRASIGGSLLESGLSFTSFGAHIWPQGNLDMVLMPGVNGGNYFSQQDRTASRAEWREVYSLSLTALGTHNLKFGSTLTGTSERGIVQKHPVDILDPAGVLLERVSFTPGQPIHRSDIEAGFFGQDHWMVGAHFAIDTGLRAEQQEITETMRVAPRLGVAWTPFSGGNTVVRAGTGVFYDRVPLNVYGFSSYPSQIVTHYAPDGSLIGDPLFFYNVTETAVRSGLPFIYGARQNGNFAPYSVNWNVQIEQRILPTLKVRANYLQSSSGGLIVLNPQVVQGQNALVLNGNGASYLRQFDLTANWNTGRETQLYFSYVHSQTTGDLNEFSTYLANFPPAVILPNQYSTLPGDVPNRFLTWGLIRFPWKFRLIPKVEYRSGFPYSPTDILHNYAGMPNQARFPGYLALDARISKDFKVSDKCTLRFSVSGANLTNHFNPDTVHANLADSQYGIFLGQHKRRFAIDFDVIF